MTGGATGGAGGLVASRSMTSSASAASSPASGWGLEASGSWRGAGSLRSTREDSMLRCIEGSVARASSSTSSPAGFFVPGIKEDGALTSTSASEGASNLAGTDGFDEGGGLSANWFQSNE